MKSEYCQGFFIDRSVGNFLSGNLLPQGSDGFLVADTVVRVVFLCFIHIPEEMDAEVAVETVILDGA